MSDWELRDKELLRELESKAKTGEITETTLITDDRVLARISDGIYREPASALRELIANAYDADATRVIIQTDAPRFDNITVRDNGAGMTREALVRLINHIGGSAKRQSYGTNIGVSHKENPSLSPGGRPLIGKIGIGLFSVSQLCRDFQIITKRKGEKYRLVAEISLRRYNEELPELPAGEVEAGSVRIKTVRATDERAHGTDIILTKLSPPARDLLRSRDIWDRVTESEHADDKGDTFTPPTYHIGRVNSAGDVLDRTEHLPWGPRDSPEARFAKLHERVLAETGERNAKPRLEMALDRYLRTLWFLSLAAPLDYLDGKHPFDLTGKDFKKVFLLSNAQSGTATEHKLGARESIREKFDLRAPVRGPGALSRFEVFVDDVKLARPLAFDGRPSKRESDATKAPLLFIGKFDPNLSKIPADRSGGQHLSFESYLLWTPRVVPTDHIGEMIRIADASGTLFDNTFLGYQVAEITRLSQISSELFVLRGLDSALNIDRESFNFGHPHAKLVASWLHRALRQVATVQKRVGKEVRDAERATKHSGSLAKTEKLVETELETLGIDEPPDVAIVDDDPSEIKRLRREGTAAFDRTVILGGVSQNKGAVQKNNAESFEKKMLAVITLLDAYGLLKRLSYAQQQSLLKAIAEIFGGEE